MIKYFSHEQVEELKQKTTIIDIINKYAIRTDESYNDQKTYKIKDRFGSSNGFFVFKDGKGFIRHGTQEKGNIIDFCKLYFNESYIEALNRINSISHVVKDFDNDKNGTKLFQNNYHNYQNKNRSKLTTKEIKNVPFVFPAKDKDIRTIYYYLIAVRHINQKLVSELINNNDIVQIRQDNHVYCGFVGKDKENLAKYLMLRSCSDRYVFKQEIAGSKKKYGFKIIDKNNIDIGKSDIYVFESPIDAMSHKTLYPEKTGIRISLGGTSEIALQNLIDTYNLKNNKIIFCLDNDSDKEINIGQNRANELMFKFKNLGFNASIETPVNKDFNEDLKKAYSIYQKNATKDTEICEK